MLQNYRDIILENELDFSGIVKFYNGERMFSSDQRLIGIYSLDWLAIIYFFVCFVLFHLYFLPPNLLLVRSHQAEIIIVKRLIQGRNKVSDEGGS